MVHHGRMKKTGRPEDVPPTAKRLPDGRWVDDQYEDGVPHGGWRYYDDEGETTEIAYYDKGVRYKSYRYFALGNATLDLAGRKGEVTRSARGAADQVRFADDLPAFPSRDTMKIEFTMSDVDPAKGTFTLGDVTYFDGNGKRLSASGGVGKAPVPGAVLLKAGNDRMWRSGPSGTSGTWRYYEIDGTPSFETELERGALVAVAMLVDGAWLRQRFLPTPGWSADDLSIEHQPKGHVLSRRGKRHTLTPASTNPSDLIARARTFFEPVRKTRGARLRIGKHDVTRFDYALRRKPFAVARIAEAGGGDEYVLVLEPGPYEGRVFLNFHEEGLFSVETLAEWVKDMLPELIGKKETVKSVLADPERLISLTPFVQNPVADSVEAFIADLRVEIDEDWRKRLEALSGKKLKVISTPKSKSSKPPVAARRAPSKVRSKAGPKKTATSKTATSKTSKTKARARRPKKN